MELLSDNKSVSKSIFISPCEATLLVGAKQKVSVKFCPEGPGLSLDASIVLKISPVLEDTYVMLRGYGSWTGLFVGLPLEDDSAYRNTVAWVSWFQEHKSNDTTGPVICTSKDFVLFESEESYKPPGVQLEIFQKKEATMAVKEEAYRLLMIQKIHQIQNAALVAETSSVLKPQIVINTHICDFGEIAWGNSQTRSINLHAFGDAESTLIMDTSAIPSCFKVLNFNNGSLTVAPGDKRTFLIEFSGHCLKEELGVQQSCQMAISVGENGLRTVIKVLAKVVSPSLTISPLKVDFGSPVQVGRRRSSVIRVTNTSKTSLEWESDLSNSPYTPLVASKGQKRKAKLSSNPNKQEVVIEPFSGTLKAGESVFCQIHFTPLEEKVYDATIYVRPLHSHNSSKLSVVGRGTQSVLEVQPSTITFPQILPHSEGIEAKFSLHNPQPYPVEVYMIDYDNQYMDEQMSVGVLPLSAWSNGEVMFVPIQEPGQTQALPSFQGADFSKHQTIPNANDVNRKTSIDIRTSNDPSSGANGSQPDADGPIIIVHGPPYSGKTTLAKQLAAIYSYGYLPIEETFNAGYETSGLKAPLDFAQKTQQGTTHTKGVDVQSEGGTAGSLRASLEEGANQSASTPEDILLCDLLKCHLNQESCNKGAVVDGILHRNVAPQRIARLLKQAAGRRRVILVNLNLDSRTVQEREQYANKEIVREELRRYSVTPISESLYHQLTEKDQMFYNISLKNYHLRLTKLEHKRSKPFGGDNGVMLVERRSDEVQKHKESKQPRKQQSEHRNEKAALRGLAKVQADRDKGTTKQSKQHGKDSALEKVDGAEAQPEQAIADASLFLTEITSVMYELYHSTLEPIIATFKQSEKPVLTRNTLISTEKKGARKLPISSNITGQLLESQVSNGSLTEIADLDVHSTDDNGIIGIYDIPGTLNKDALIERVTSLLSLKLEDSGTKPWEPDILGFVERQVVRMPPCQGLSRRKPTCFSICNVGTLGEKEDEQLQYSQETSATMTKTEVKRTGKLVSPGKLSVTVTSQEDGKPDKGEDNMNKLLKPYRWVIGAQDSRELSVKFLSNEVGQFTGQFDFAIAGCSSASFSLNCSGVCQYPEIESNPAVLFSKRTEGQNQFGYSSTLNAYDFGPLWLSKKYPPEATIDSKACLTLSNSGAADAHIGLSIKNEVKGVEVFTLEASNVDVASGEAMNVVINALPRSTGRYEDILILSVKDNPQPLQITLSCLGVKPELEIEKKGFNFEKLLLQHSDHREVILKNNIQLPIAWKLTGWENLGDEFDIKPIEGIVSSLSESRIVAKFHALKVSSIKKSLRLEVYDADKTSGVTQVETLFLAAEAFDLAVDLHFPRGLDGIDFGTLKVPDDPIKQVFTMKNRGKYEAGFRFIYEEDWGSFFTISTQTQLSVQEGVIPPSEKPSTFQLTFKSEVEASLVDLPCIKCQIYDPSTGETTTTLPIKVSLRAVFSHYSIQPPAELNFGNILHGTKPVKSVVIENTGDYEFRYSIAKILPLMDMKNAGKSKLTTRNSKQLLDLSESTLQNSKFQPKKEVAKAADTQAFGPFTITPATAIIPAGNKQVVNIEFHPEIGGVYQEVLLLEVTDSCPTDSHGYKLVGESCTPIISTKEVQTIFSEYAICRRYDNKKFLQNHIFAEESRTFHFKPILVGQTTLAQFKIANPGKIAADVSISVHPISRLKDSAELPFDVEPQKLTIPSHDTRFVNVSFHPTSIQQYTAIFEALVMTEETIVHAPSLLFNLVGQGTLPHLSIKHSPDERSSTSHVVVFPRTSMGLQERMRLVIFNDGIIPARYRLELSKERESSFFVEDTPVVLLPNQEHTVSIVFQPNTIGPLCEELRLLTIDNTFEDEKISLVGESHNDSVLFTNLPAGDANANIVFSNCYIGSETSCTFKATNNTTTVLTMKWSESPHPNLFVEPVICTLAPHAIADVKISFKPDAPEQIVGALFNVTITPGSTSGESHDTVLQTIKVSALADFCFFEFYPLKETITFKSTYMMQCRSIPVVLKNTGKVPLTYSYKIQSHDMEGIDDTPFTVSPDSGVVESGDEERAIVRFLPMDAKDYSCVLLVSIPNLSPDMKVVPINLSGTALRPLCHFEVDDSDYLRSDRRSKETAIASGISSIMDTGTKVVEFRDCIGVTSKGMKKI
ncbi:hypothetical protein HDU93_001049, partial [Gonapodya sp. JEL0774]